MSVRKSVSQKSKRTLRRIKIGYHHYEQRRDGDWAPPRVVPFVRLSGDWLQQAGFDIGKTVNVQIKQGRITLVPEP
jgi:toxic protein SymE